MRSPALRPNRPDTARDGCVCHTTTCSGATGLSGMPVAIYETEYGYALVADFKKFNRVVNSEIHQHLKQNIHYP